jgi:hypothetical protein
MQTRARDPRAEQAQMKTMKRVKLQLYGSFVLGGGRAASRACSSFGVTPEGARHDYIIISEKLSKFRAPLKLDAKFSYANSQAKQSLTS